MLAASARFNVEAAVQVAHDRWRKVSLLPASGFGHVLFTLHYSSKNEVTFLEILDMSTVPGYSGIISNVLDSVAHTSRKYNGCDVREYPDGFEVTTHDQLVEKGGIYSHLCQLQDFA